MVRLGKGDLALPRGTRPYGVQLQEKVEREGFSLSGFERDKLFVNTGGGAFIDVSSVSGADSPSDGRAVLVCDFDNDGRTDLFVTNMQREHHELYACRWETGGRWLRVILQGTRSNRDAVGALAIARIVSMDRGSGSGPRLLARQVDCGGSFLCSPDKRLLFGLGDAGGVDELEVRWPSGLVQRFGELRGNQTIRIIEGDSEPRVVDLPRFRLGGDIESEAVAARRTGFPLPEIALTTLHGTSIRSQDLAGRWSILNLWSPSCAPCLTEMPELERLARRLGGRLRVIGVAMTGDDQRAAVLETVSRLSVTYEIALAPADLPSRLFGGDERVLIPTSFLVDPQGLVTGTYQGISDLARLERDVARSVAP